MKKRILTVAVAALALAACSKNETVQVADSNLIGFNAFVGKATRAVTDVTTDNIEAFRVYGQRDNTPIFSGEEVYESGTANVWVYDNPVAWKSGVYTFAAYSDGGKKDEAEVAEGTTVNWNGTVLEITGYKAGETQKDLVVSIANNAGDVGTNNVPVEFSFKHALSMIKFTLNSTIGDSEAATVTITDFKVSGIEGQANLSYDGTTFTWSNWSTQVDLNNKDEIKATASKAGVSNQFVVIPRTEANKASFTVTFNAQLPSGEVKPLTATISEQVFAAGYRYNYVATITGEDMDVITFADPEVTPWTSDYEVGLGDVAEQ